MKKQIDKQKSVLAVAAFLAVSSYVYVKNMDTEYKDIIKTALSSTQVSNATLANLSDEEILNSYISYKSNNRDKPTVSLSDYKKICEKFNELKKQKDIERKCQQLKGDQVNNKKLKR